MAIEIKAPTFPESVADGTVATWHKKPGDAVKRDELIVDIETDKVVMEVLAEADGVLAEIVKNEGETVLSGELLGRLGAAGAAVAAAPAAAAAAPAAAAPAAAAPYKHLKHIVWCQEEPMNQGAWYCSQHHMRRVASAHKKELFLQYAGRDASAAPACGYASMHAEQQEKLLNDAFTV